MSALLKEIEEKCQESIRKIEQMIQEYEEEVEE